MYDLVDLVIVVMFGLFFIGLPLLLFIMHYRDLFICSYCHRRVHKSDDYNKDHKRCSKEFHNRINKNLCARCGINEIICVFYCNMCDPMNSRHRGYTQYPKLRKILNYFH